MAKIDIRNKILNAKDNEQEKVHIKQWDVEVLVKGMSGKERDTLLQDCVNQQSGVTDMGKMNTALVMQCCYDPETEEKVFESADADMIASKSAGALSKIIAVASRLSGLDEDALGDSVKN
jgi:hypothetical protein